MAVPKAATAILNTVLLLVAALLLLLALLELPHSTHPSLLNQLHAPRVAYALFFCLRPAAPRA
jgi:hypothetical protein